ncbi:hypothetical protein N431DRAFT_360608 [Stipitochalara longipes BDJ]|nr:hypothetical protein N431DRAFT_360608 [Stipitochalara longipes BDJ]
MDSTYNPPLSLTIIGTIFIGSTALVAAWIAFDIIVRRGWETMMAIMIPVYILNALYLAPITLWTYLKYGRPEKPGGKMNSMDMGSEKKMEASEAQHGGHDMSGHEHMHMSMNNGAGHGVGGHDHSQMKMEEAGHDMSGHNHSGMDMHNEQHNMNSEHDINHDNHIHGTMDSPKLHHGGGAALTDHSQHANHNMAGMDHMEGHDMSAATPVNTRIEPPLKHHNMLGMDYLGGHDMAAGTPANTRIEQPSHPPTNHHDMSHMDHSAMDHSKMNHSTMHHGAMHNMHLPSATQPMFPTVTIAVCHCGAGCLLGDIVGEWLVFGTNATLGSKSIGPEFLIDYAFALAFGMVFQYLSIAPMSGDWGPRTLWRALKADFLSLTCFEIGLFGWMAIFQFGIFGQKLGMDNVVYWWMMQIGMFFGHWTAFPINWWLITSKVKERVV